MTKRHSDAIAIQEGASNPIAIANAIVAAIAEIRTEATYEPGTATITSDPALKLMIHQLSYICGVTSGSEEMPRQPDYSACHKACIDAMQIPAPTQEKQGYTAADVSDAAEASERLGDDALEEYEKTQGAR